MTHLEQAEALNKPATHPAAGTIQSIIEHLKEEKEYGMWQVCPKCEGEGVVLNDRMGATNSNTFRACPVCNGEKKLVRPEIKKEDSV